MKPKRIILIRHGQSEGNVSKQVYTQKPDFALNLTELGKEQAFRAGQKLSALIKNESVFCYVSPYYRTRQTFEQVKQFFPLVEYREDPRLREQEWSTLLRCDDKKDEELERDRTSKFYYRFRHGESCADVYDRISTFLDTLHRDFEKPNFPENCVVFGHGMTNRIILMRWFHWTVEQFEKISNPQNCEFYIMEKNSDDKYYNLITPPKEHAKLARQF